MVYVKPGDVNQSVTMTTATKSLCKKKLDSL